MPTSSNGAYPGGAIGGSPIKPINNPKIVTITPATNGFVVQMSKVAEYGQDYAVATTVDEVGTIISTYFTA